MRHQKPVWKVLLAFMSLLLTMLIWAQGLKESFDRPSVTPKLSIKQQEIAVLAKPAIPPFLKSFLVGEDPESNLRESLIALPKDQIENRQRFLIASFEPLRKDRQSILQIVGNDEFFVNSKKVLIDPPLPNEVSSFVNNNLKMIKDDHLLYQSICLGIGGDLDLCVDKEVSKVMAVRLAISQCFPPIAVFIGVCLLIRQFWLLLRKSNVPWPSIVAMPLSLIDMVLLVAGGFVVMGEVIFPLFVAPLSQLLTSGIPSPLSDSLKVFIGYSAMTFPPLLILRQQLQGLDVAERPGGGWLQWGLKPINNGLLKALYGWLMILPPVLLTGLFINRFFGDQGGSNPLLELVLRSHDPFALFLLVFITVIFAPVFEEIIFRGVLLPVLANKMGASLGIFVSALVFALAHLSVGEFPPLLVLGIGLAILRISSGRLFPSIFMHSLWNGVTFSSLLLLS